MFFLFLILFNINSAIWVQNGNFSLSFNDGNLDKEFSLSRNYNSLSSSKGYFGYNWGTAFESRINVISKSMLMIEEIPGGARTHFVPKDSLEKALDEIINSVLEKKQSPEYVKELKDKLAQNRFIIFDFIKGKDLGTPAVGTIMYALEQSDERLKVLKNGYIRERNDGITETFNKNGNLIKRTYQSGYYIRFEYDTSNRLRSVVDASGKKIDFYFNQNDLIVKAVFNNNKTASYTYDGSYNLISSIDTEGNKYNYNYDSYHRMVEHEEVLKNKSNKWIIKYDNKTGRVRYQKEPNEFETFISYSKDSGLKGSYEVIEVTKKYINQVVSEKYEYWRRPKPDGTMYDYKIREKRPGFDKTVTYTMCCNTPLVVTENGQTTYFEYNQKGRLVKKVFPDSRSILIKYDEKDNLSYISNNGVIHHFKYNDKKQIVFAATKDIKFKISYDKVGRVSEVQDDRSNHFKLTYDESGNLKALSSKYGIITIEGSSVKASSGAKENISKIRNAYQEYVDIMMVFTLIATN